jgi:branched-chain amino acid transport system ATP-binding protein
VAILSFGDRVYILNDGHIVFEGTLDELHADPEIMKSHLGV